MAPARLPIPNPYPALFPRRDMGEEIIPLGRAVSTSAQSTLERPAVAILIPCYNEELTIGGVVHQFRTQLPNASVYVFDNNSTDQTVTQARDAGASIYYERRQGKGYVVQSMFRRLDADVYVMVDGDGTYPPSEVHKLIEPVLSGEADMVIGSRLHEESHSQLNFLNRLGNKLFLSALKLTFKVQIADLLSGYRAFSRKFVKGLPLFGGGFETEAEFTIKALQRGYKVVEIPVTLIRRPEGSHSKIRIARDGLRILHTILALFRDYKPLTFFGAMGLVLIFLGFVPGLSVTLEFFRTGLVPRLPSAVLAAALVLAGMLSITIGLILHTIARRSQELEFQLEMLKEEWGKQLRSR
jgi:glycosyltransferase involved in cell wall biosynthesis